MENGLLGETKEEEEEEEEEEDWLRGALQVGILGERINRALVNAHWGLKTGYSGVGTGFE